MKTAAPEKKSVKTLKGQLFGAVSMMLVAAIALGTSTYAWFINNRTVEVQDMQLTVSTSTSMLVAIQKKGAADYMGYTGYKSIITNDDIKGAIAAGTDYAGWTEFFNQQMVPASVTDDNLKLASPTFFATNNHVSNGKLDEFLQVPAADATVDSVTTYGLGQGPVKKLGLRFVSSNDLDVYFGKEALNTIADMITPEHAMSQEDIDKLTGDAKTKAQAVFDAETKQAAAIRAALRVSVVAKTTGVAADGTADSSTYAAADVHTFQFDLGAPYVTGNANNTFYTITPSISVSEPDGRYSAIKSVDSSKHITADGLLSALVPGHATPAQNANKALATVTKGEVKAPTADGIKLFQLKKDIARDVDVYIWLEGTDQDCLNSISGFKFNLALPFSGADTPTT